jgi:hypothetical protein
VSVYGKEDLRKRIPFMETFLVDNYEIWHRITNYFFNKRISARKVIPRTAEKKIYGNL